MQIAIAVGTILLSGWALNEPLEDERARSFDEEQQGLMEEAAPSPMQRRSGLMDRSLEKATPRAGEGGAQMPSRSTSGDQPTIMQQRRMMTMPLSPTDSVPSGAEGMLGQPASPTSGGPSSNASGSVMGPGAFGARTPVAPTQQRRSSFSSQSSGYRPMSSGMGDPSRGAMRSSNDSAALSLPPAAAAPAQKAFANYRASSPVSPYMNLFRTGNALGTIDNYTTLVRPQLEQRYLNQQFGSNIGSIESNYRAQQLRLQQLNQQQQQNRTLQGVGTPQFHMNYQNYYPEYGQ